MAVFLRRASMGAAAVLVLGLCGACSDATVDTTDRNSAGEVVEGGDVGVLKLQVGDCISKAALDGTSDPSASPTAQEVDSLAAVPCTEPHGGEVVLVSQDMFKDLDEFPSVDDLFTQAEAPCIKAIADYTGFDFEEFLNSTAPADVDTIFAPYTMVPTADSWDTGDRGMLCVAITVDEALETVVETTGSAKQAG